ncbi:MAG: metallophosphoesterase [Clostridia bacterium]|nr:metallophosphoesterase [Clostridia bacterium]
MMKKLISILLVVLMMAGISLPAFANGQDNTTATPLQFGADGQFSVMHVTDTHLDDDNVDASVWLIAAACDREQPDLVVITGDNVQNCDDASKTKGYIDKLMSVFESRNIPTAVTFGNHDSETGAMSREELMAYYNTFSCSVSLDDGPALSGCGTYNIPVLSSDGSAVKFNVWVFDSNDYDGNGHYGNVKADQVAWYKAKSEALKAANGGEKVYSLAFQHIIVPEVYDALKKAKGKTLFAFEHIINKGEYYMFDPNGINYGTLNETPCSGYINEGQFEAMVGQGDVLGMFTGHDHTNAFGVKHKGIDIVNSLSTRYNGDAFSTQYGYRMLYVNENDTSVYTSKVVHWYDLFSSEDVADLRSAGDDYGVSLVRDVRFKGFFQKMFTFIERGFASVFTGRKVSYPD